MTKIGNIQNPSRVKTNLYNVFVMYALCTSQFRRMKRSQSLAVLFDKPGRRERQVDPNTNPPNLIDSNVELYMCRILLLVGSAHVKFEFDLIIKPGLSNSYSRRAVVLTHNKLAKEWQSIQQLLTKTEPGLPKP